MVDMTDPSIQSYERPMLKAELDDYGTVLFGDYHFYVGVSLKDRNNQKNLEIPEDIGRF